MTKNNKRVRKAVLRKALFSSVISLVLCCTMLVGTTFAWFTDSVTSANNIIKSGNLDVVLEYKTDWADNWAEVKEDTKLFDENALYEPGYTEVIYLRISNAGNLALKYQLKANIIGETPSTNVNGDSFKLSDYLEIGYYVQDEYSSGANYADLLIPTMFDTRDNAIKNAKNITKLSDFNGILGTSDDPILPGTETAQVAVLVLNMPETVDNEANHKSDVAAPTINLGITLLATQFMHEEDSFGNDYDEKAEYFPVVSTLAELREAMATGGEYKLGANINIVPTDSLYKADGGHSDGSAFIIKADTVIDLNGYNITYDAPGSYSDVFFA